MRSVAFLAAFVLVLPLAPAGAGILEDISSGKLINPEVGVFAWYELNDKATNTKLYLRQAVVGQERVKRKDGYWVETELIPQVGFPAVYKMLLTGPANEPGTIHELIVKEGEEPPKKMPVEESTAAPSPEVKEERQSAGMEKVVIAEGSIEAEHVVIAKGNQKIEVWLNDTVRPLGIVKMVSPEGELVLQRFGKGGPDGESRITADKATQTPTQTTTERIHVRGEDGVTKNFSGKAKKE